MELPIEDARWDPAATSIGKRSRTSQKVPYDHSASSVAEIGHSSGIAGDLYPHRITADDRPRRRAARARCPTGWPLHPEDARPNSTGGTSPRIGPGCRGLIPDRDVPDTVPAGRPAGTPCWWPAARRTSRLATMVRGHRASMFVSHGVTGSSSARALAEELEESASVEGRRHQRPRINFIECMRTRKE